MGDFDFACLEQVAHRPWPLPSGPWTMTQTWRSLLFAHWPVSPRDLQSRIPAPLAVDLFQDTAWITIVPFAMSNVAPRGLTSTPLASAFPELNVRTYVTHAGRPGVFFFSLDAASGLAVLTARTLFNLPYHRAAMRCRVIASGIDYESRRGDPRSDAQFVASYQPAGAAFTATPGSLDYFLTERYCLYHVYRSQRAYRLDIHHAPWRLQHADLRIDRNTMGQINGFVLADRPALFHYADRQDVVSWWPVAL